MAQVLEVSNDAYHAMVDSLSATQLKTALDSPQTFYARYVAKTLAGPHTDSMLLGSVVHSLVLTPALFLSEFAIRPDKMQATAKADFAYRCFKERKRIITRNFYNKAQRIADAVLAHVIENGEERMTVAEWVSCSYVERAILWDEGGMGFKCKPDIFRPQPNRVCDVHLDLKTTDDPRPSAWVNRLPRHKPECMVEAHPSSPIAKYRYDLQVAAHYTAGIEALTGRDCASGVIAVGVREPHEVFVYDMTTYRPIGNEYRKAAIDIVRVGRDTGDWTWREQKQITVA